MAELGWLTARPLAHRGLHDRTQGRPENSLAAFRAAIQHGYGIECDLRLSHDGVPVVFHDASLERLTATTGPVAERCAASLASMALLDTDETIPTLEAALTCVAGRVALLLELKPAPGREAAFARATTASLRSYAGHAALMSFDRTIVAELRRQAPELVLGLTAEGDWTQAVAQIRAVVAHRLQFMSYAVSDLPTVGPLIARHLLRLPVLTWTVRTRTGHARAARWADQITFEGFLP
jgi:glycerophosphoryl diester phosphodiesterase